MSDFKTRLLDERAQLRDRIQKLTDFVDGGNDFDGLPVDEQESLREQLEAMHAYQTILVTRTKRLGIG